MEVAGRLVAAAWLKGIQNDQMSEVDNLLEVEERLLEAEVVELHFRSPGYHRTAGRERSSPEEHLSRQILHRGQEELPCLIDCSRHWNRHIPLPGRHHIRSPVAHLGAEEGHLAVVAMEQHRLMVRRIRQNVGRSRRNCHLRHGLQPKEVQPLHPDHNRRGVRDHRVVAMARPGR